MPEFLGGSRWGDFPQARNCTFAFLGGGDDCFSLGPATHLLSGQTFTSSAKVCPKLGHVGDVDHFWAMLAYVGSFSGDFGGVQDISTKIERFRPTSDELCQFRAISGRFWRVWPILVQRRPNLVRVRPTLAILGESALLWRWQRVGLKTCSVKICVAGSG